MAAISTVVAVASLSVAAVGTVASIQQGREAAKAQRRQVRAQQEAQKVQEKRDAVIAQQQRFQEQREQQLQRAQLVAAGAAAGDGSFSGQQGGLSASASRGTANETFANQINMFNAEIGSNLQQAADSGFRAQQHGVQAQNAGSLAQLGLNIFGNTGRSFQSLTANSVSVGSPNAPARL